ncbi:MAG: winged helix-turn-helix domain-containing protein [Acidimicrobiia bacterium]|nr:winged helix-turn-helix domain-containing protein [Acidimicrobiia bacterium]
MPRSELSAAQARRIAVAAQGLAGRRPGARGAKVDRRHFRAVVDTVGAVQLDSVNVITRAHELTFFARLGPYDRGALSEWLYRSGEVFEQLWHAACFIDTNLHPALRWRITDDHERRARWIEEHRSYLDEVLQRAEDAGPLVPADLRDPGTRRRGTWWDWDLAKEALEVLFWRGDLTAYRGRNFERFYDLPERVLPSTTLALPALPEEEGRREVLRRSARAMGVATADDIARYSYGHLNKVAARASVVAMAADGELDATTVEGWDVPAYLYPGTKVPARVNARALLAPFDSLVWERERPLRIFDFHYRIEIYVPAPKRIFGYYVVPFLLNDRLVARVDLKADRKASALLARAAYSEAGVDVGWVAEELAAELRLMAGWLGLDDVVVTDRGDLAPLVAKAVTTRS